MSIQPDLCIEYLIIYCTWYGMVIYCTWYGMVMLHCFLAMPVTGPTSPILGADSPFTTVKLDLDSTTCNNSLYWLTFSFWSTVNLICINGLKNMELFLLEGVRLNIQWGSEYWTSLVFQYGCWMLGIQKSEYRTGSQRFFIILVMWIKNVLGIIGHLDWDSNVPDHSNTGN